MLQAVGCVFYRQYLKQFRLYSATVAVVRAYNLQFIDPYVIILGVGSKKYARKKQRNGCENWFHTI
jgi:hypothetical protein